jgi:hypothetical protein
MVQKSVLVVAKLTNVEFQFSDFFFVLVRGHGPLDFPIDQKRALVDPICIRPPETAS